MRNHHSTGADSTERHGCSICGRSLVLRTEEIVAGDPDQWWECPAGHSQPPRFNGRKTYPLFPELP